MSSLTPAMSKYLSNRGLAKVFNSLEGALGLIMKATRDLQIINREFASSIAAEENLRPGSNNGELPNSSDRVGFNLKSLLGRIESGEKEVASFARVMFLPIVSVMKSIKGIRGSVIDGFNKYRESAEVEDRLTAPLFKENNLGIVQELLKN